jgi:hypothetical protein
VPGARQARRLHHNLVLFDDGRLTVLQVATLVARISQFDGENAVKKLLMALAVLGVQFLPAMNVLSPASPLASVAQAGRRQTVITHTNVKRNGTVKVKSYTVRGWVRR